MIISNNYSTNQYKQNFGANLKIVNGTTNKLSEEVVEFLETEFPNATKALSGSVTVKVADGGKMSEFRHIFPDGLNLLEARINSASESKEQLLTKFKCIADGFLSRVNIVSKKKPIKDEISRLKVALEVEGLPVDKLFKDERYLKIQELKKQILQLDEEDRKVKDNMVKNLGFKNVDLNGIFSLIG